MTAHPIRLQLSRKKGFNLQSLSLAANGLPAVNVARPSPYGNPFVIGEDAHRLYAAFHKGVVPDAATAVALFRAVLVNELRQSTDHADRACDLIAALRGHNLACWCKPGDPCHADVLIEMANPPCPTCHGIGWRQILLPSTQPDAEPCPDCRNPLAKPCPWILP
ncbi:MAG: DUF4326 domain-containing protein [Alphaproteobacteria bacterium]|jgi:hypothetical protein|nr:DUF4326 domain-containing protein [Alphaproteobacteria bacterium]